MLTKKQIDLINAKASIFEPCVEFAHRFLVLPSIQIAFCDCPSAKFRTMDNAAERSASSVIAKVQTANWNPTRIRLLWCG